MLKNLEGERSLGSIFISLNDDPSVTLSFRLTRGGGETMSDSKEQKTTLASFPSSVIVEHISAAIIGL